MDLVRDGNALRKAGDFPRAEEAYRHATGIDPRCAYAWAELGCLMSDCRRFAEAIGSFRQVLGKVIETKACESAHEAVQLLLEIVATRPDWVRGQFSLGCAYEHLEDFRTGSHASF